MDICAKKFSFSIRLAICANNGGIMSDAKYLSIPSVTSNLHKTIPFINFRPHPTDTTAHLKEKGCFSKANKAIYRELLDLTDLNETECIHDDLDPYSGITLYVSRQKLANESGYSLRQVSYALKELRGCKVIKQLDKHPETGCYRYKLTIYDDSIEYLKANPDHPRCQVETLEPSPEQIQAYAESAMAMFDRLESLESAQNAENEGVQALQGWGADIAHNKDYKEEKNTPHTAAALERNILEPPAQQEQHEVDLDGTTRKHLEPETVEEEKNSLRVKEGDSVFVSVSFSLADRFAGNAAEYVDDGLRNERAGVIEGILWDMFRSRAAIAIYSDLNKRTRACAEVMKVWITAVKHLEYPPDQIGFIKTKRGRKILADAKAKVFGSENNRQKWATGEDEDTTIGTNTKKALTADTDKGWTKEAIETYEQMLGPYWRDVLRARKDE